MFFIPLLFGGAAATYMHKKFPKTTEAVAAGVTKATVWTLKQAGNLALKALDMQTGNDTCKQCGSPLAVATDANPEGYCTNVACLLSKRIKQIEISPEE